MDPRKLANGPTTFQVLGGARLIDNAKYNLLELKENLENYKTKKENAIDLLDVIKVL